MHHRAAASFLMPALLALGFINLLWSFTLLWASFGLPVVLVLAVFLDYLITRLRHHRRRQVARVRPPSDHFGG